MPKNEELKWKSSARREPARKAYGQRGADSEFINRELTEVELADYRKWREDLLNVSAHMDEAIENGYKLSIKYDDYSSSPCCFLFPPEGSDNTGKILTGRGGSSLRALAECMYKHAVLFRGVWVSTERARNAADDPDW